MLKMYTKGQPYLMCLNREELDALELSLRDSLEQHEEHDLFGVKTVNTMRQLLSDIHELQES